jgi:hypothetical protein
MSDEIIFMRDNGEDGLDLTDVNNPDAIAYVRSDLVGTINITKRWSFYRPGGEDMNDMEGACQDCINNIKDESDYPCGACVHNA